MILFQLHLFYDYHSPSPYCFYILVSFGSETYERKGVIKTERGEGECDWTHFGETHTQTISQVSAVLNVSDCSDEGREAHGRQHFYSRSPGSLVAGLGGDPAPPDAQAHILLFRICSRSKAPGLLSSQRALSCPSPAEVLWAGAAGLQRVLPLVSYDSCPQTDHCLL